jgi:tetratricopeptide (TPR) repeat protein
VLARAIDREPESAALHIARGDAFLQQGSEARAIESYEQALTVAPDALVPLQNTAWLFATSTRDPIRNGARAVTLAEKAVRVSGGNDPVVLRTLAAAHAENGDFALDPCHCEQSRASLPSRLIRRSWPNWNATSRASGPARRFDTPSGQNSYPVPMRGSHELLSVARDPAPRFASLGITGWRFRCWVATTVLT